MLGKIVTTEPPDISNDNFEEQLATDDLLVHYFNDFLSLPVFYEAVRYNKESGIFEVVTAAAESLTQQIRSAILEYRSKLLNEAELSYSPMIDNSYTVLCLDREQGIQWIKRERLPLFLWSDCYFEYRLAKLLSQVDSSCLGRRLQVDSTYRPWAVTSDGRPASVPVQNDDETLPRIQGSTTQSRDWLTLTNQSQGSLSTQSITIPVQPLSVSSQDTLSPTTADITNDLFSTPPTSRDPDSPKDTVECKRTKQSQSLGEARVVRIKETRFAEPQRSRSAPHTLTASDLEDCARSVVRQVLDNAVSELEPGSPSAQGESGSKGSPRTQETEAKPGQPAGSHTEARIDGPPATEHAQKAEESEDSELGDETEEIDDEVGLSGIHGTQMALQDFKSFLQGTPGVNLFHLWMDIERLQSHQNKSSKNRHLIQMRSQYLLGSGRYALTVEVLSRLGLASTPCWTEDKLHLTQPRITEVLLLYWWPRFCTAQSEEGVTASLRLWRDRQLRPPTGIDPSPRTVTLLPLRPASCSPRLTCSSSQQMLDSKQTSVGPHTHRAGSSCPKPLWENLHPVSSRSVPTMHWASRTRSQSANQKSSLSPLSLSFTRTPPLTKQLMSDGSCSPFLGGRRMERMLQALQSEMRSGLCFTHFCESSRNQLWANSIHFWTELQDYHRLFYQNGLDPYRVQQQAQLLYSVYLSPGARMTVGVDEESRREVQACLTPPFEELFDLAEEHVLTLLFDPWTMMTARDRATYEKVDLWDDTRRIQTTHYRKLQVLHRKLLRRLNECVPERRPPPPPPEVPTEPDLWAQVPEQFRSYRLGSVLRHRLELQHFHSFLEEHFASMDLMCWLDIEQYKRLPQKDRAEREERSKDIRSRYISRKYFFGPNSPASREQQEEVIRLGGGWGRILHCRLLGAALAEEVQNHVKRRIEKKWLPLFLAMPEFAERQKVKSQVDDVVEDQLFLRHRKKREVWKHVDGTWMTSSKEILAFRRALLNPVTCHQFQRYVSLKGDFLENGVLFWLEVQRYKNLFHSHCDEATIQQKVILITNSFINSPIPPALQIDIPAEQARDILERRRELGPYVFREAQMTVFNQLFKLWPEFLSFRTNVGEEHVLSMLEGRKEKQREKLLRRRREEERRAQEEAEKQKSSLADGLFEDGGSVFGGSQEGETGRENGVPAYPPPLVSWSYSKYISALEQEQALLQSHTQLDRGSPPPPRPQEQVPPGTV
ncbi:hypothetical protein COCON_G00010360 [Conger conger]|uniref:RGS domain-containing protein n=1 Tax=Conger conger TaxID=82655 RepID=A0A9Q1E2F4_CONCO|nr:hypothetical protein COCON_G00010360 [Conger conger]